MHCAVLSLALAALLGQAPAETAWLKALPADAEVVVRLRGIDAYRDDMLAMLKAMSPGAAEQAEAVLDQMLDELKRRVGEHAAARPMLVAIRLPNPAELESPPPMAFLLSSDNYNEVLKSLSGADDPKPEKLDGGYESITSDDGEKLFTYKGDGFVAFTPFNDALIKAIAARPTAALDSKIPAEARSILFSGDLSAHVDLAATQKHYADQINEAKETFMAMLDQAGEQMQAGQMQQVKQIYAAMFDGLKQTESLTVSFDWSAEAFDLTGLLTVKSGSELDQMTKSAKLGTGEKLASLPTNELMYIYLNFDPAGMETLMRMNMGNLGVAQIDEAAMKKSIEAMKAAGRQESVAAMSLKNPVSVFTLITPENPAQLISATKDTMRAMQSSPMIKEATFQEAALTHKGFTLDKATVTFDVDKMMEMQAQGNEAAAEILKRFMGGSMTTYFGTDGKQTLSVVADTPDEAKAKIDAVLSGSGGIGATDGFKAVRSRMPKEVGVIVMLNAQESVKQAAALLGKITGADVPVPDMPKEPAFLGGSFASTSAGFRFDFVVPTTVGPVFERGFGTLIQAMQGQVGQ